MTRAKPPSSHPQVVPGDESPTNPSLLRRIGIGHVVLGVGLVAIATAQILTTGHEAPRAAASTPAAPLITTSAHDTAGLRAGNSTTPPSPSPGVAKTATPPATATRKPAKSPTQTKKPDSPAEATDAGVPAHGRADEAEPRTAGPIEPSHFACKPVRKDTTIKKDQYAVPLPPFSKGVFPCTRCHDKPEDFNTNKRTLTLDHTNIKLVHGPREQWCYGCHNPSDRDKLRLAGGRTVTFEKSYELCGQCHGPKLRDWRAGIHGRRTGCWNGQREYLLCVHCHSPHAPKFKSVAPKPRPKRPTEIQLPKHAAGGK